VIVYAIKLVEIPGPVQKFEETNHLPRLFASVPVVRRLRVVSRRMPS